MPWTKLLQGVLLPELKLLKVERIGAESRLDVYVETTSEGEVCPRCATLSRCVYDHRWVCLKDEPLRDRHVSLRIRKRRFKCGGCGGVFTEPVAGVMKGRRTTERYRRAILRACAQFVDLKRVRDHFRCSGGYLYKVHNEQLARRLGHRRRAWPRVVGIDEHAFRRNKQFGHMEFVTVITDLSRPRVMEMVHGKTTHALQDALGDMPGAESVQYVAMDMCDPFRAFIRNALPQAQIVADKFHVLRLLHGPINRERKLVTGDRRTLPVRKILLKSGHKLDPLMRHCLAQWLEKHPTLRELYVYKEALHRLYRTRGQRRAAIALNAITDAMAKSQVPDILRLRRTLMRWRQEILNYFRTRITNARTEGFNNLAKVIKRRAYGYKNFDNYRLRVLNAAY